MLRRGCGDVAGSVTGCWCLCLLHRGRRRRGYILISWSSRSTGLLSSSGSGCSVQRARHLVSKRISMPRCGCQGLRVVATGVSAPTDRARKCPARRHANRCQGTGAIVYSSRQYSSWSVTQINVCGRNSRISSARMVCLTSMSPSPTPSLDSLHNSSTQMAAHSKLLIHGTDVRKPRFDCRAPEKPSNSTTVYIRAIKPSPAFRSTDQTKQRYCTLSTTVTDHHHRWAFLGSCTDQ